MRSMPKVVGLTVVLGLGALPPFVGPGSLCAREETPPAQSARGGTLARTAHHQFEVFFYASGVRMFVSDVSGAVVGHSGLSATATFYHPNSPSPWFSRPLRPASAPPGLPVESLDLAMDFQTIPRSGARVIFEVGGLPGPGGPTSKFTVTFTLVETGPNSPRALQPTSPAHSGRPPKEQARHYPVAGLYRLSSGAVIWVPSPGYYYGAPVQYHTHRQSTGAPERVTARRAPDMGRIVAARGSAPVKPAQKELYWRPRAFAGAPPTRTVPNRAAPRSNGR